MADTPTPTPYPTKTRLALLRDVANGYVFRDALGIHYISGGVKVCARIREAREAGWVHLDGDHWELTQLGRDVLNAYGEVTR